MAAPTQEQIRQLWRELNMPSAEVLHRELRASGFRPPPLATLRQEFRREAAPQLFRHPPRYTGHVTSLGLDSKWVMDIMELPETESGGRTYRYVLVAQDEFSRTAWAAPIADPQRAAEGLREILRRAGKAPDFLLTDADPGFLHAAAFQELLRERGIVQELKMGRQDLATVDRLIGYIKRSLALYERATGDRDWPKRLPAVVDGFNRKGAPKLYGSRPGNLRGPGGEIGNKELYFQRLWDESREMQENARGIHARAARLEGEGAFRTLVPFKGPRRRVGDQVWSDALHPARAADGASRVDGPIVTDAQGRAHLTKETLAAPSDSTAVAPARLRLRAGARELLRAYADRLEARLRGTAGHELTAQAAQAAMTAGGHNLRQAMQLAGVSVDGVVANFVRVFPDRFTLQAGDRRGVYVVRLAA